MYMDLFRKLLFLNQSNRFGAVNCQRDGDTFQDKTGFGGRIQEAQLDRIVTAQIYVVVSLGAGLKS